MKSKQKQDIRTKNGEELHKQLQEERKSLLSLLVDHSQFTLKSPRLIFMKRKEIAYIQTVIEEKKREELTVAAAKSESK